MAKNYLTEKEVIQRSPSDQSEDDQSAIGALESEHSSAGGVENQGYPPEAVLSVVR